jgi:hypothetical protein
MGLAFSDALRSARANQIISAINAGAGTGSLKLYTAPQPAKGAAITTQTLLGTLPFQEPAGSVTDGILTIDIDPDDLADADGDVAWARILDGDGAFVADATVTDTAGAGPIKMASVTVYEGGPLAFTSFTITEGNG